MSHCLWRLAILSSKPILTSNLLLWSLLLLFFTFNASSSAVDAEARAYRQRGSASPLARRQLLASHSSSSLQAWQHEAVHVPSWGRFLLQPRYLSCSHWRQIEFLSSYHFNSCQEKNIKDPQQLLPPTAMWLHICSAQWHTVGGKQLLWMCAR